MKVYEGSSGRDAWPPRLLLAIWIYAYSRGVSSAREITRQCEWEPGLQWLTGLQKVNFHTLSVFRVKRGEGPAQILADGDDTNRKSIREAAGKGVDFIGSWGKYEKNVPGRGIDAGFAPSDFEWDEEANEAICPAGKRLVHIRTNQTEGNGAIYTYAAKREDCQACEMLTRCTPNNKMEKHGRAVSIRLEDDRVDVFLTKMETEEAKAIYKKRAPIAEFPNAWLKTKLNWARVRSRGLKRVAAEAIWPALTYNLQRYFAITRAQTQTA
ncbi:MAG: transposase [Bryobacterales bacterium]|nr:transposase [Bryobacterales bacterium]